MHHFVRHLARLGMISPDCIIIVLDHLHFLLPRSNAGTSFSYHASSVSSSNRALLRYGRHI